MPLPLLFTSVLDHPTLLLTISLAVCVPTALVLLYFRPRAKPTTQMTTPSATLSSSLPCLSVAELAQFDGSDESRPIYVGIRGKVYDVSTARESYAKGRGYNVFAGRDATLALALSCLQPDTITKTYAELNENEQKTLAQWETFFAEKKAYPVVATYPFPC